MRPRNDKDRKHFTPTKQLNSSCLESRRSASERRTENQSLADYINDAARSEHRRWGASHSNKASVLCSAGLWRTEIQHAEKGPLESESTVTLVQFQDLCNKYKLKK